MLTTSNQLIEAVMIAGQGEKHVELEASQLKGDIPQIGCLVAEGVFGDSQLLRDGQLGSPI